MAQSEQGTVSSATSFRKLNGAALKSIESITRKEIDLSSVVDGVNDEDVLKTKQKYSFHFDGLEFVISLSRSDSGRNAPYLSVYFSIPNGKTNDHRAIDVKVQLGAEELRLTTKRVYQLCNSSMGWSKFSKIRTLRDVPVLNIEILLTYDTTFERPSIKEIPSKMSKHEKQYYLCTKNGDIKLRVVNPSENITQTDEDGEHPPSKKKRKLNPKSECEKEKSGLEEGDEGYESGSENVVKVSSCILRAASPVFDQMLSADMRESQENKIVINAKSVEDVDELVYFMCTDQLSPDANPLNLISLAHMYQMKRLFWICAEKISKTVTIESFVETVDTLNRYEIEQGFPLVVSFGKKNIEELKKRDEFSKLSCAFKRMILGVSQSDI